MTTKAQLKDYANACQASDKWIYNEKQQRVINRNYKEPELSFILPSETVKEVFEPEIINEVVTLGGKVDYYAHPAMSQSKMKTLLKSPRQYYLKHVAKIIDEEDDHTVNMQLGNCLDWALTEPGKYESLTIKNTKTTKQKDCVTLDWKLKIEKWRESLLNYKFEGDDFFGGADFRTITKYCDKQSEYFYTYENIEWKMKTDYVMIKNGMNFFIDLKSTSATSAEEFEEQFVNLGYYIQSASYAKGLKLVHDLSELPLAYYIAISKVTGEIFCYHCSEQVQELGMMEIDRGCRLYHHNIATGDWAKDTPVKELVLPFWLDKQIRGKIKC